MYPLLPQLLTHLHRQAIKPAGAALECDYFSDEMAACRHWGACRVEIWALIDLWEEVGASVPCSHRSFCADCGYTFGWKQDAS